MPEPEIEVIGSLDFVVYANVETIDDYALGSASADAWRDSEDEEKQRFAITATRIIERQVWAGEPTEDDQLLAFPRTGLEDAYGNDVADSTIPQAVVDAACELAIALADGSDVENQGTTESDVESLKAGSVSISFWRGTGLPPGRFPQAVDELLGLWLSSAATGSSLVSEATGMDGCSFTNQDFGVTEGS